MDKPDGLLKVELLEAELAAGKEFEYFKDLHHHLSLSPLPPNSTIVKLWGVGGGVPGAAAMLSPEFIKLMEPVAAGVALPAAAYIGKKLIDVVAEAVKEWLNKRSDKRVVIALYGPDGEVVKLVKSDKQIHVYQLKKEKP